MLMRWSAPWEERKGKALVLINGEKYFANKKTLHLRFAIDEDWDSDTYELSTTDSEYDSSDSFTAGNIGYNE